MQQSISSLSMRRHLRTTSTRLAASNMSYRASAMEGSTAFAQDSVGRTGSICSSFAVWPQRKAGGKAFAFVIFIFALKRRMALGSCMGLSAV
jgi:hypothetical protein